MSASHALPVISTPTTSTMGAPRADSYSQPRGLSLLPKDGIHPQWGLQVRPGGDRAAAGCSPGTQRPSLTVNCSLPSPMSARFSHQKITGIPGNWRDPVSRDSPNSHPLRGMSRKQKNGQHTLHFQLLLRVSPQTLTMMSPLTVPSTPQRD